MNTNTSNNTPLPTTSSAGNDISNRFALDVQGLDGLKAAAGRSPEAGAKVVAKQFDAVFLQMMLKSMRDATPTEGPFDSHDSATYTSMLDQQLAQHLSSKGVGVADEMLKQLLRNGNLGEAGAAGAVGDVAGTGRGLDRVAGTPGAGAADRGRVAERSAISGAVLAMAGRGNAPSFADGNLPMGQVAGNLPIGPAFGGLPMGSRNAMPMSAPAVMAAQALATAMSEGGGMGAMSDGGSANADALSAALNDASPTVATGAVTPDYRTLATLANAYLNPAANGALAHAKGFAHHMVEPPVRSNTGSARADRFIDRLAEPARAASAATGIPARFIIGQAALESGWGNKEIKHYNGATSHNVFGIKATGDWKGPTITAITTEYVNGQPQRVPAKFRAYGSYAEAMTDYAKVLRSNPRYATVLASAHDVNGFAHGMQKAGYATDPQYAQKLISIMQKMV
jgi:flagellar protein FlgJ